MKFLTTAALFGLMSCGYTTLNGKYTGIVQDVHYGGLIFSSCEAKFKTSSDSSNYEQASSYDKSMCDLLQNNLGLSVVVHYRDSNFNPLISTDTLIEKVQTFTGE